MKPLFHTALECPRCSSSVSVATINYNNAEIVSRLKNDFFSKGNNFEIRCSDGNNLNFLKLVWDNYDALGRKILILKHINV